MDREWNDNQPIYRQLRDRVVAMILDGVLKEGDPLPSVRTVAADYRLNPLTVLKGYQELVDEELVEKKRGLGMYVKDGARNLLSRRLFGTLGPDQFAATPNFDYGRVLQFGRLGLKFAQNDPALCVSANVETLSRFSHFDASPIIRDNGVHSGDIPREAAWSNCDLFRLHKKTDLPRRIWNH